MLHLPFRILGASLPRRAFPPLWVVLFSRASFWILWIFHSIIGGSLACSMFLLRGLRVLIWVFLHMQHLLYIWHIRIFVIFYMHVHIYIDVCSVFILLA